MIRGQSGQPVKAGRLLDFVAGHDRLAHDFAITRTVQHPNVHAYGSALGADSNFMLFHSSLPICPSPYVSAGANGASLGSQDLRPIGNLVTGFSTASP